MNITELCVWGQVRAPYILYSISIQKITQLTFQILLLFGLTSLSLSFITSDATSQFCSSILLSKVTQFIIHCLEKKKYGYNCCIMCIKLQLSKVPIVFCCNAVVSITTIIKWTKVKYYCCSCNTKRTLLSNIKCISCNWYFNLLNKTLCDAFVFPKLQWNMYFAASVQL